MTTDRLATHSIYGSNVGLVDTFTVNQFRALLNKARLHLFEHKSPHLHTFAISHYAAGVTPDTDETRAIEDSKGESFETEPHELNPLDRIREADRFATED